MNHSAILEIAIFVSKSQMSSNMHYSEPNTNSNSQSARDEDQFAISLSMNLMSKVDDIIIYSGPELADKYHSST